MLCLPCCDPLHACCIPGTYFCTLHTACCSSLAFQPPAELAKTLEVSACQALLSQHIHLPA